MNKNVDDLRTRLQALTERTGRDMAERDSVRVLSRELVRALPLVLLVPGLFALWLIARRSAGDRVLRFVEGPFDVVPVIGFALLALVPLVAWAALRVFFALRVRPHRERALAVLDRRLALEDRLVAADEFMEREQRTGFEQAAVEDAVVALESAGSAILPPVEFAWRPGLRGAAVLVAALAACVLVARVELVRPEPVETAQSLEVGRVDGASSIDEANERRPSSGREPLTEEVAARTSIERRPQPAVRSTARATDVPAQIKQSQGETREGQSSDAQASSGAGAAKGSPSNQEQKSAGEAKSEQAPKPPKESAARPDEEQPKTQADEDSGSTAGKGSGQGSNKNSVASPWSSKDQVDTPDDQEVADDQDFEDDAEEQKARGGMQPNLRDRRPPVSRDLSIGFGNRPSPDANGRGGPSDQKKSRGTASLVLGVPLPDRVTGQPNKGKTKITQERVEPRTEDADPVAADVRPPSNAPIGSVPKPGASPFVREAVRSYFMALRAQPSP